MPVSTRKKKTKRRLTAGERREDMLDAALPLFAEVGFRGTTTKMLAQRLGVSEALLYQHFPSKEALFSAVQEHICVRHPALEKTLTSQEPSTDLLVFLMYLLVQLMVDPPPAFDIGKAVPRVMLQSILDDGSFARAHIERNLQPMIRLAEASIAAARKAGDIVSQDGIPDDLRFILAHHVVVMVHLGRLPATPLFDYPKMDRVIDHVVRFVLRGLGLTDAAVARCYDPARLKVRLADIMKNHPESSLNGKRG